MRSVAPAPQMRRINSAEPERPLLILIHKPYLRTQFPMPKKHKRVFAVKPTSSPHHSLTQTSRNDQNGSETRSVNDLISHLRRTQVGAIAPTEYSASAISQVSFQRSIHPALRHHLSIPSSPSPRPRQTQTPVGERPRRQAPGPRAPESWLSNHETDSSVADHSDDYDDSCFYETTYRLQRLPGVIFPAPNSLGDLVLKRMSQEWPEFVEDNGPNLALFPNHIKTQLLSYLALYGPNSVRWNMKGLYPLFIPGATAYGLEGRDPEFGAEQCILADSMFSRLDLSGALGIWLSMRELIHEVAVRQPVIDDSAYGVPDSWDETNPKMDNHIPRALVPKRRFAELRYLSLAHPAPSVSWTSLLPLFQHLPTLTHLSLAFWPAPSGPKLRPSHAHSISQDPVDQSDKLAQDAGILRQMSRLTYCLEWLDLEGCTDWLAALTWTGTDPDGNPYPFGSGGPEWNGSWRKVKWINLAPGRTLVPRDWDADGTRYEEELQSWSNDVDVAVQAKAQINAIRRQARGSLIQAYVGKGEIDLEK